MDRGAAETPTEAAQPSNPDDYEWLRCLARSSPVGIYRADAAGLCKYVNERWCELAGYPVETALGVGWERVIHPEDRARVHEEWGRMATLGVPFRSEYRYLQPSGKVVWIFGEVVEERALEDVDDPAALRGDALDHAAVRVLGQRPAVQQDDGHSLTCNAVSGRATLHPGAFIDRDHFGGCAAARTR